MGDFFSSIRGYLKIKVWGYSPERFMNLCRNHGISLWGIGKFEDNTETSGYEMYIGLSDFFRLRPIARKTGTRAVVLERYGLPFLLQKMKRRKMFIGGILFCFVFLISMSQFIWSIEFEGNYSLTDDVLIDFMEKNGVEYGEYKKRIDIEKIESQIRENFDEVTWTSVKIEGTRLIVQIRENDLFQENRNRETDEVYQGSNLVANADGMVYSILTRSGVPLVSAGDMVKKGDILVSGAIPVYNDDGSIKCYQYCHADADIVTDYGVEIRISQPLEYEYKNYTGREKKNIFLETGGYLFRVRLHKCEYTYFDTIKNIRQVKVLSQIYLPLYYGQEIHREYQPVEAVYDTVTAEKILRERLDKKLRSLSEKGVQIIQKDVTIDTVGKYVYLDGIFRVRGFIGQTCPIEITDPPAEKETKSRSNN